MQRTETAGIRGRERRITARTRRITAGRVLRALAVVVVIPLAIGSAVVWLRGESVVGGVVEHIASQVTDTPVRVGRTDVRLRSSAVDLADLRVGNPRGFGSGDALFGVVETVVGDAVGADPIVLDSLRVQAPLVRVEIQEHARVNVFVLRDQIRASARAGRPGPPKAELGDVIADRASRAHVRVRELAIAPARVVVDASEYGPDEPIELTLAPIALADVGGERGMTPAELTRTITLALLDATVEKMIGVDVRGLREGVPEALGGLRRTGRKLLGRD